MSGTVARAGGASGTSLAAEPADVTAQLKALNLQFLEVGSISPQVVDLRKDLAKAGYPVPAPANPEVFDQALGDALGKWQTKKGLTSDSQVGRQAWAGLKLGRVGAKAIPPSRQGLALPNAPLTVADGFGKRQATIPQPPAAGMPAGMSANADLMKAIARNVRVPNVTLAGASAATCSLGPLGENVLMIGDSHTVGPLGLAVYDAARAKGAQLKCYGSAGATADYFLKGTITRSGNSEPGPDGRPVAASNWQAPHATPLLSDLVAQNKPTGVMIALGANMRGLGPADRARQVRALAAQAKGLPLVWVGPPKTEADGVAAPELAKFDDEMEKLVAPYGKYVRSSPYIDHFVGEDAAMHIHYRGPAGEAVARQWGAGVVEEIAKSTST